MHSDLSSTSSCEDWGNPHPLFALLQTAKPKQVLSKHQDCYSELLYFKKNRKENSLVYSSVLSPISVPVSSVLVLVLILIFLHFSPGSGMNMAQTCGLPIARALSCFPYSTPFLDIFCSRHQAGLDEVLALEEGAFQAGAVPGSHSAWGCLCL